MTTSDLDQATAGDVLFAALPARALCHLTRTKRLEQLAHQALHVQHWPIQALVERCTSGDIGVNPGGVITSRLEWCATNPAPAAAKRAIPFCSPECRDNAGWRLDPVTGLPIEKCPCRTPQGDN